MWIFSRKRKDQEDAKKEAKIQAIREDMNKQIDHATKSIAKLNKLLEKDATLRIFYATGGDRRGKHGR